MPLFGYNLQLVTIVDIKAKAIDEACDELQVSRASVLEKVELKV